MRNWLTHLLHELGHTTEVLTRLAHGYFKNTTQIERKIMLLSLVSSFLLVSSVILFANRFSKHQPYPDLEDLPGEVAKAQPPVMIDLKNPVRDEPATFPRNHRMPTRSEYPSSGRINLATFNPTHDLVYVEDDRVWWESDYDKNDTEDDHQVHRSIEVPLRRLINLVHENGGRLKVQDAYRALGIHHANSLHKEGRALDLTCDELGLEKLSKLCWAAGFDWVFHEAPKRGGHHVHVSTKTSINKSY